jgi:hypothetical protein
MLNISRKTKAIIGCALFVLFGFGLPIYILKNLTPATALKELGSTKADADRIAALEAQLQAIKTKEVADQDMGQFVVNMMYKSPTTVKSLSPAVMQVMVRNIVRDLDDVMGDDVIMKEMFVGAVQIESKFLRNAQSPTGPKGLSQTTRATFHEALKSCGVNDVRDSDVWDMDMSIYAGACYFKALYTAYYNKQCPDNPKEPWTKKVCAASMASVAYNQGPDSEAAKSFAKTGLVTELEPAIYQGKVIVNMTTTIDQKMPGVPSVNDLPKPKATGSRLKPSLKTSK